MPKEGCRMWEYKDTWCLCLRVVVHPIGHQHRQANLVLYRPVACTPSYFCQVWAWWPIQESTFHNQQMLTSYYRNLSWTKFSRLVEGNFQFWTVLTQDSILWGRVRKNSQCQRIQCFKCRNHSSPFILHRILPRRTFTDSNICWNIGLILLSGVIYQAGSWFCKDTPRCLIVFDC